MPAVPSVLIPSHALRSMLHTVLNSEAVCSPLKPLLATQEREDTMQLHSSELTVGGRLVEAAQSAPVAGHACAMVFEEA